MIKLEEYKDPEGEVLETYSVGDLLRIVQDWKKNLELNHKDIYEVPVYWSSTEHSATNAWYLYLNNRALITWHDKVVISGKVRPVFNFNIKESSTEKKDSSNYHSQTSEQSVPSVNISSNDSWRNIIDVYRKDGSIRKVSIMKDRNTGKFCFVNLTLSHVCKCRFDTFGDAIEDLMTREEVEYFDIHYTKNPIIE